MTTVGVLGPPLKHLGGFNFNEIHGFVRKALKTNLQSLLPSLVIVGSDLGVEQWTCEFCIELGIPYKMVIANKEAYQRWAPKNQSHYHYLTAKAKECHILAPNFSPQMWHRKNTIVQTEADKLLSIRDPITHQNLMSNIIEHIDLPEEMAVQAKGWLAQQEIKKISSEIKNSGILELPTYTTAKILPTDWLSKIKFKEPSIPFIVASNTGAPISIDDPFTFPSFLDGSHQTTKYEEPPKPVAKQIDTDNPAPRLEFKRKIEL